jgi:hypothetical protein
VTLLAWPASGRAGDDGAGDIESLDLENLLDTPVDVWTAAKMAQKQYEAPAVITTVTREQIVGDAGGIYPIAMLHLGVVGQHPRIPLRGAIQGSYIGARRASDTNILLNGGPYRLAPYLLVDARLSTSGFHLFGVRDTETSFALSGKNLLGAQGPMPGSSGVDYPLAPRALLLQMNFAF